MRIAVCIKQILDPRAVRLSRSREAIDPRQAARIVNPPDRYALEAALRLRERHGGEVIALSVGARDVSDALREALAMGADRAILLSDEMLAGADASGVARALARAVEHIGDVSLVLTGERALDTGGGTLPARLAQELGWPVVTDASEPQLEDSILRAFQRDEKQRWSVSVALPAVLAVTRQREKPRYPPALRIAWAYREAEVETWDCDDLGLSPEEISARHTEERNLVMPPERNLGFILSGSPEEAARSLVAELRGKRLI
ncbi:MAG: electron transfer flavoprotein subunit beta/FixA family protein [Anaerolineae bacterium]|nr:electron transfer flavoprotein subunit beta/FixA family protein [Anaerolineae bacterium]